MLKKDRRREAGKLVLKKDRRRKAGKLVLCSGETIENNARILMGPWRRIHSHHQYIYVCKGSYKSVSFSVEKKGNFFWITLYFFQLLFQGQIILYISQYPHSLNKPLDLLYTVAK